MSRLQVHGPDLAAIEWSSRDSAPTFIPRIDGRINRYASAKLDPTPSYAHDLAVVKATARQVTRRFRPRWPVHAFVLDREEVGRTNGFSTIDMHWNRREDGTYGPPLGLIVLSGKRIPPHPAVTRYLVAHEYGHNVEWMLEHARDPKRVQCGDLLEEYAEANRLDVHHGNPGNWHNSAAEVFACDFRILVCGVEPEFWPHPGVPRPEKRRAAVQFWRKHAPSQVAA